jgi:hypothetical protein
MSATGRAPQRHWASGQDQAIAGHRYVVVFADLDVPHPSKLNDALATIAAAGPHTRVALTPQPGKRLWSYDPATRVLVHQLPDAVANDGSAAVLQYIRRRPGFRQPLELHVSQRQIAFDADHGLGGWHFVAELISALLALSSGRTSPWITDDDSRLALPRALIRTFGFHPTRARMAWRCAAGLRSNRTVPPSVTAGSESVAWSPSFAVTVAHVNANAESSVNEWRCENGEKAGSAAIWLYVVRQALRASGLQMTDEVVIAFDCRRYLPKRLTANSNFAEGLEVPFAVNEALPTIITRLRECTVSAVPLAVMGAVSARLLFRAGRQPVTPTSCNVDVPASVMYSDLGHITSLDDLPWRGQDERSLTGLLGPAAPESITVLNSRIGSTRNISITFHDNVFDRRIIERAAEYLKDPIRFLASNAAPPPL